MPNIKRYADIGGKYPREVALLKSLGCGHRGCAFCDYHEDFESEVSACTEFNSKILKNITGKRGVLQVIDSASFCDLPTDTAKAIEALCRSKGIRELIAEQHFLERKGIEAIKESFFKQGVSNVIFIAGIETFDAYFRERILKKGLGEVSINEIGSYFDWGNLLFGVKGQSMDMLRRDIDTGLKRLKRLTVNIFIPNATPFERDAYLVGEFYAGRLFEEIKDNPAIEILDFLDERAPDNLGGIGYKEEGVE
ncbi:MAG: hypothetical protein LBQ27_02385 [Clostridiales bacterium]|nr:hypothetical protein [Clostridiales bacterium]